MAAILLVEDEIVVLEFAKLIIEDMGHQAIAASDVDEALVALRTAQPIDALFTDIRLKSAVLGGYELAQQARTLRPPLRVLYASGNSTTDKTKTLFVKGAHFVPKPYSAEQLKSALEVLFATPEELAESTPSL
ncbi:MAG: response regulator [Alphaproteobacteria bacterium]|nr:response regulator [Alphaproteobacteria bacterium]